MTLRVAVMGGDQRTVEGGRALGRERLRRRLPEQAARRGQRREQALAAAAGGKVRLDCCQLLAVETAVEQLLR